MNICYTLLSDGSSDRALIPVLDWLLKSHCPACTLAPQWSDLARLPHPPKTLAEKIRLTLDLYPCNLLFIHRDAEKQGYDARREEILMSLQDIASPPAICVIPVRMQEAWLLLDETAIKKAAGNPSAADKLLLPKPGRVEQIPDPKEILFDLLRNASGLTGARLKRLNLHKCVHRLSTLIDDFSPLRGFPAFNRLESELLQTIQTQGWNRPSFP